MNPNGTRYIHGHTQGNKATRTFRIWTNMRTRCSNAKASNFAYYGGRGIKVCDRWHSFAAFLADMGECPDGMTLDRLDADKNYEPSNCRWVTIEVQANNKRNSRWLNVAGERMTMAQASRRYGVSVGTLWARLRLNWPDEEAVGLKPHAQMVFNRHSGTTAPRKNLAAT